MALRLDPRIPLVWRTPFDLQLGVDPPIVVLHDLPGAEERMIAALATGATRSALLVVARGCGTTDADARRRVDALLRTLQPALLPTTPPPPTPDAEGSRAPTPDADGSRAPRIAVHGAGRTIDLIAALLRAEGMTVVSGARATREPASLGIAVCHFAADGAATAPWLRRDVPHLLIRYSDAAVEVGPLVEPGVTACSHCIERHRRDADAAWVAIASQLLGRRSAAESELLAMEAAAAAARLVRARIEGGPEASRRESTSIVIDASTGRTSPRTWTPHPECGCRDPLAAISAVRPGSDWAGAAERDSPRQPPRRAAGSGGHG
ncbi:TOMM precursor leader peptide-binding protein [Galbitalea soli]|uniref:TOMM leader peptide-binding protein n=1 Tax=Galbitalea soli TaxID=1268042 RepID=A0A7C9PM39_9MICO|nr:TOMM precursor leader peptide-binding protein [Galbitalea soli]NEM90586.1 TOMM precursor leader peptide-binding protein [Galbitalea soli]NYJ31302.1 bacteriocin biosynthesis cyclodehydratase domain-containing protein [Galbitalea soli]